MTTQLLKQEATKHLNKCCHNSYFNRFRFTTESNFRAVEAKYYSSHDSEYTQPEIGIMFEFL